MNPSTPNHGREKGIWYVLEAGPYNQALVGLSREEIAAWAISLGKALALQKRGINAFADELMDERDRYLAERRKTGRMGCRAPKKGHPGVTSGSPQGDGEALPNRTETGPNQSTEPRSPPSRSAIPNGNNFGFGKVDKYTKFDALVTDDLLVNFATEFCRDADRTRAIFGYKAVISKIGKEAFKSELIAFFGEVEAGEEPRNRGAAFMARLKRLVAAKKGAA